MRLIKSSATMDSLRTLIKMQKYYNYYRYKNKLYTNELSSFLSLCTKKKRKSSYNLISNFLFKVSPSTIFITKIQLTFMHFGLICSQRWLWDDHNHLCETRFLERQLLRPGFHSKHFVTVLIITAVPADLFFRKPDGGIEILHQLVFCSSFCRARIVTDKNTKTPMSNRWLILELYIKNGFNYWINYKHVRL